MSAEHQDRPAGGADDTTDTVHRALRREVNEHISGVNHSFGLAESETIDVLCECVHADCTGRVVLTVSEYEGVRRFPTRFLVKTGHHVSARDEVVVERDGYLVVEKAGGRDLYAVGAGGRG